MPYDPKRLNEDRTPPKPRAAPRGTSADDTMTALRDGHCVQCGKAYLMGAQIGRNHAASRSNWGAEPDGYCLDCWTAMHESD
jgi:hypothetical protein